MSTVIKFRIGDVSIAIEWAGQPEIGDIPEAYLQFLWIGRTDIRLRLCRGLPELECGQTVFDSPPIWSLHRHDGTSVIRMFREHDGLDRYLVLPDHMRHATLYFTHENGRFLDPFFGPTLELLMINYLARGKGVMIHACGVELNGKGYLFAGESGAGKSTIANLWAAENDVLVLSDDRTVVRPRGKDIWMYGTPWHGEARYGSPQGVKLDGIFFLQHGKKNSARKIANSKSVVSLLQASFSPHWDKPGMDFTMSFLDELVQTVGCRQLSFKPEKSAIDYLKSKA